MPKKKKNLKKKTNKKIVLCLGEVIHIFIEFLATPMITVIPFSWGMEGVMSIITRKFIKTYAHV